MDRQTGGQTELLPELLSGAKKQVDSKREKMDESNISNMFKENIIKEMFQDSL